MGLLDAIFGNDGSGGGLLGGLPREWQYENPPSQGFPGQQAPIFANPPAQDQSPLNPVEQQMMSLLGRPGYQPGLPAPIPGAPLPPGPAARAAAPTAAPETADPIAVGKYQMPRIGNPDLYDPEQTDTPPAAKPVQGAQPSNAVQAALAASQPGPGASALAGLQSFANTPGGLVQKIIGGIAGGVSGQRTDPTGMQQQAANLTARALVQKGVDPTVAQAAIGNPELMKTLIAQNFGPDRFQHVTVKNQDGSESAQAFDPSTGKYSGGGNAQAPSKFSVDPELTGKDRLDALRAVDPLYARKIESMVAGDLPMPTGVAALRPDAKRQIEDALAVDGSTSASDFQTRASTRRDYASGIASRVTKSINTTIGHFATLDQAIDKLGNYTYFPRVSNAVHDIYSSNMDPAYQKAKATFETNKEAAIKELDYALSGGHSSVSGSAEIRDKFNRADSPETLHAAVTEAMSLLQKRLESHTKAFTEGTKSQRDPQDFIYPENRQAFSRMLGEKDSGSSAPAAGGLPSGWSVQVR